MLDVVIEDDVLLDGVVVFDQVVFFAILRHQHQSSKERFLPLQNFDVLGGGLMVGLGEPDVGGLLGEAGVGLGEEGFFELVQVGVFDCVDLLQVDDQTDDLVVCGTGTCQVLAVLATTVAGSYGFLVDQHIHLGVSPGHILHYRQLISPQDHSLLQLGQRQRIVFPQLIVGNEIGLSVVIGEQLLVYVVDLYVLVY